MSYCYLPVLGAGSSGGSSLDGEPFAPLRSRGTARKGSSSDSAKDSYNRSRSGTTCELSTGDRGVDAFISSLADFHAPIYRPLDAERELKAPSPVFGKRWPEYFSTFDPRSHGWKIPPYSPGEDWTLCSQTLPRWGMTRRGALFRLPTPEGLRSEKESGFWPTPRSSDGNGAAIHGDGGLDLRTAAGMWPTSRANKQSGRDREDFSPSLHNAVRMWPTVRASDGEKGGPNQRGNKGDAMLPAAIHSWETPTARDYRTGDKPEHRRARNVTQKHTPMLNDQAAPGLQLNPDWVELLMGWPPGWTHLPPEVVLRLRAEARRNSRGNRPAHAKDSKAVPNESGPSETDKTRGLSRSRGKS